MRVAYLCDGKSCRRPSCMGNPAGNAGGCQHTTKREHAVNGGCDAPEAEPERFVELEPGTFAEKVSGFLQSDNGAGESKDE